MSSTPRELVYQALNFERPARAPRQLWALPWASLHHGEALEAIRRDFPDDIGGVSGHWREIPKTQGDPHRVGTYTDDWGCTFVNLQDGVIGEVKEPLVRDWDADSGALRVPREWLTIDRDAVNRDCAASDRFLLAGGPQPFERLQFLRGSEALYMDLADPQPGMLRLLRRIHSFYCELLETWVRTDVDGVQFSDDWGSQRGLLIHPARWRELFLPLYRDYAQIAHGAGKRIFMHSDGHILDIYPDLVDIGIDAINSQVFCMGVEKLAPFAGQITFWGEVDRQALLPRATPGEIHLAVEDVHGRLWRDGGCIAQCEFGAGARPDNVREVFAAWDELTRNEEPIGAAAD